MQHIQHSITQSKQFNIPEIGYVYNIAQLIPTWNKEITISLQFLWPTWIRKTQEYFLASFTRKGFWQTSWKKSCNINTHITIFAF